jgi:hypothetical protein
MAKHPKPHFVKGKGKWLACYGNNSKGSKFRAQIVVAEGETISAANSLYFEILNTRYCGKGSM